MACKIRPESLPIKAYADDFRLFRAVDLNLIGYRYNTITLVFFITYVSSVGYDISKTLRVLIHGSAGRPTTARYGNIAEGRTQTLLAVDHDPMGNHSNVLRLPHIMDTDDRTATHSGNF